MNLTPKSQAIFQSFFLCKTKDQLSNNFQNKSQLSNRQVHDKHKQILNKPISTSIQQIGNVDNQKTRNDRFRKMTIDESQLTVIGIRRTSRVSQIFEQIQQVPKISQDQQRKTLWIQTPEKQLSSFTRIISPDQEKKSKLIVKMRQLQSIQDNTCPLIKINFQKKKLQKQDGFDEYFKDKLFHQQRMSPVQNDKIRFIIGRHKQGLSLESQKIENKKIIHD